MWGWETDVKSVIVFRFYLDLAKESVPLGILSSLSLSLSICILFSAPRPSSPREASECKWLMMSQEKAERERKENGTGKRGWGEKKTGPPLEHWADKERVTTSIYLPRGRWRSFSHYSLSLPFFSIFSHAADGRDVYDARMQTIIIPLLFCSFA